MICDTRKLKVFLTSNKSDDANECSWLTYQNLETVNKSNLRDLSLAGLLCNVINTWMSGRNCFENT